MFQRRGLLDFRRAALPQDGVQRGIRLHPHRFQAGEFLDNHGLFLLKRGKLLFRNQAEPVALFQQPQIGVILPQQQAMFGARREHAVRLFRAERHEIVNHHADVSVGAAQNERRFAAQFQRGVHARRKALRRRFLVAGRAVDLPRMV